MPFDALKKLHTAMLDTREGYEVAERDAETPELKSFFSEMIALRQHDHEAIHQVLTGKGEQVDDSGSFMATIHKAATSMRAVVTGLDANALSPFISGEEQIADEYDAAIAESSSDTDVREMLTRQKDELTARIAKMKAMKAAADA